jgi:hypothetical protein
MLHVNRHRLRDGQTVGAVRDEKWRMPDASLSEIVVASTTCGR